MLNCIKLRFDEHNQNIEFFPIRASKAIDDRNQ